MNVTLEAACITAALSLCALFLIPTHLVRLSSPKYPLDLVTCASSGTKNAPVGQLPCFQHLVNALPLFAAPTLCFQYFGDSFRKNTEGRGYVRKFHPLFDAIHISSGASVVFTVAPRQPEIRCAGTAASERRLCGRARGWNSRSRCWPRPRAASSSPQMLLLPGRWRHCF